MNKKVAILVLAFNRPEHVAQALIPVRLYQPDRLYLACDGPRIDKDGETELVIATQKAMLEAVSWTCEVKTLFRDKNLGCAKAVFEAISWFFRHEEYGVIIEDDVIVGQDFFMLSESLLPRYIHEERVMEIAAQNHSMRKDIPNTYVYTQTGHCWGWATWRRAWQKMDMEMKAANHLSSCFLVKRLGLFRGLMMKYYFMSAYKHLKSFNSWATRWYLSILAFDGLIICPGRNLAVNIGMNEGTHYEKDDKNPYDKLVIEKLIWPIVYNDSLIVEKKQKQYDKQDFRIVRSIGLKKKLRKLL